MSSLADGQCEMSIDISETTIDVFSWFGVWEQVTAIIEMCVALGKMGRSIANGMYIMETFTLMPSSDIFQVSLEVS